MFRTPTFRSALALGLLTSLVACGGGNGSPTSPSPNPSPSPSPSLQPTFSSISSQVFQARCVGCHGGAAPQVDLSLQGTAAHGNLVNRASTEKPSLLRVAPGNPDASYLVHKLEGRSDIVGVRMPQGGPFLSQAEIDVIRTWIAQGAQNN